MLSTSMKLGTQLLGLSTLINSGRPAFDGCYRVIALGGTTVIEFFERAPGNGEHPVRFLPYRTEKIAEAALAGREVISGEFTGCVMASFKVGDALYAGHVDANKATSQRAEWDRRKSAGLAVVSEYDTTGKIQDAHGAAAVILCVADGGTGAISHFHVSKTRYQYGHHRAANAPITEYKFDTLYTVISSAGY